MRPRPRDLLRSCDQPAFITVDPVNIFYLTGVSLSSGVLLIVGQMYRLFVDARYEEAADAEARDDVRVYPLSRLSAEMAGKEIIVFEEDKLSVQKLHQWKVHFKSTKFIRSTGVIEHFRRTKDESEIRLLKRAKNIAKEMLRRVPSVLRAKVTERQLAWKLRAWAQELGAEDLAFNPIVAFGTHTSRIHHEPTNKPLKRGDMVQVDIGVTYRKYRSDLASVYFTAKPNAEQERMLETVTQALDRAMAMMKPGGDSAEIDRATRAFFTAKGYPAAYPHALGHGVGLEVHEGVTLSARRSTLALLSGEVVAVEPGLYIPGRLGMRLEQMVFVGV